MSCHDFFSLDEFDFAFENQAIYKIRSTPGLSESEKKDLIICWYQTTECLATGSTLEQCLKNASAAMSAFLKQTGFRTFEEFLTSR